MEVHMDDEICRIDFRNRITLKQAANERKKQSQVESDDEEAEEEEAESELNISQELISVPDIRDSCIDVTLCPPDLFPLASWFTQSKRETAGTSFQYLWPICPLIAITAMSRWYWRCPPGLTNYLSQQLRDHVMVRRSLGSPVHMHSDQWKGNVTRRSCNIRMMLVGSKHSGTVHIVGYRDGSRRWLFPNVVLMIDKVKHDHYREIQVPPFEIPKFKL